MVSASPFAPPPHTGTDEQLLRSLFDNTLIGMGAIVMNGARIGKHCLVAAGALVTEGTSFPDGSLIVGSPAVVKRELSPEQIRGLQDSALHYRENARRYAETIVALPSEA